jgi:hemerythrin-like domain-containing protein
MDQHIAREDQVLFPMAQEVTTAQEDAKLVEAFEELEQQGMGEGVHERYHHLVEELASKYL